MKQIVIRPAGLDDADEILRLLQEVAVASGEPPDRVRMTEERIREDGFGPDPHFETLIAESGGKCVGCVLFFRKYSTWVGAPGFYVEDLAVDASARGTGVGRELMAAVARAAVRRRYAFVDLAVDPANAARAFYERIGMREHAGWTQYRMTQPGLGELAATASTTSA